MRKKIFARILTALGGLTLWMLGLCVLAEAFFHVPVTTLAARLMERQTIVATLAVVAAAMLLCALGAGCWMMLNTRSSLKRSGFVMQKSENGAIGVSVRSIEEMVQTCVRQNDAITGATLSVTERRDGLVLLLNVDTACGISIPLAVHALQKQIRQYVSDCTGLDVQEVRVMVENTGSRLPMSPYSVQAPAAMNAAEEAVVLPEMKGDAVIPEISAGDLYAPAEAAPAEMPSVTEAPEEFADGEIAAEAEASKQPAAEENAPVPVIPVVLPVMPEMPEEEDDRPLHQRLFGTEETPVFVPAPPELAMEAAPEESAGEMETAAPEDPAEVPAESQETEFGGDAVLEVVAALADSPEVQEDPDDQ